MTDFQFGGRVVTGLGAVSCIGNNKGEILGSLKAGRSGITANESFAEMGLRSQVAGAVDIDVKEHIDRKILRFMGDSAAYAYISMQEAIEDAGLEEGDVSNLRTGLIASSGGASVGPPSSSSVASQASSLRVMAGASLSMARSMNSGSFCQWRARNCAPVIWPGSLSIGRYQMSLACRAASPM